MKRRFVFRVTTLIVISAAIIYALYMNITNDGSNIKAGNKAPDFELTQVNDNNGKNYIQLSELEGKGVLLNFWASYCKPCESQLSYMEALYSEYHDDIELIAINLDNSELVARQFANRLNLSYPVAHDSRSEIMNMYSVSPIPATFFIDAEGKVTEEVVGSMSYINLENHIEKILPAQGE